MYFTDRGLPDLATKSKKLNAEYSEDGGREDQIGQTEQLRCPGKIFQIDSGGSHNNGAIQCNLNRRFTVEHLSNIV